MSHLFKLVKDGEVVGYLRIAQVPNLGMRVEFQRVTDEKASWYVGDGLVFDTAHPFVTTDKNGKDVFEGDKAFGTVWLEDLPAHRIIGEIIYYNCGYCIQTSTTYYHLNDLTDIEILEEQDNG